MSVRLLGIGTAAPQTSVHQSDAAAIAATLLELPERRARALTMLFEHSGVETRRSVFDGNGSIRLPQRSQRQPDGPSTRTRINWYSELAPSLAVGACGEALQHARIAPGQVTHLVTVSCTGFHAPGVDISLIQHLGLDAGVQRTHIGFMGCHGAVNGMRVASALAASEGEAVVLLCCVEICSVHFQYRTDFGATTANALFGDGAAACVLGRHTSGPRLSGFGATLFDDSGAEMDWRIGDHGFEMSLSKRVPELLEHGVGDWVDRWLHKHCRTRRDIASWAVHPGGPRILEAVRASLNLHQSALSSSIDVLRTHGNMSSPTLLFIVRRMLAEDCARPLLGLAFGPGLAGELMLIED